MCRYLLRKSDSDPQMQALLSISPMLTTPGWYEWGYSKVARTQISVGTSDMPSFVINQCTNAFFGPRTHSSEPSRIAQFQNAMRKAPRSDNYALFLKTWTARDDLVTALKKKPITVPTLTFYGGNSLRDDHVLEVAGSEGVFKSPRSEMVEIWRGADLVHDEDAATVLDSFIALLQGYSVCV